MNSAGGGPIIFDVTHDDESEEVNVTDLPSPIKSPRVDVPMSPLSAAMTAVDPTLVNPAISVVAPKSNVGSPFNISNLINSSDAQEQPQQAASSVSTRPSLQRELSKEDFDADTFFMQKEIDNLKDILSGQITLDSSLISNLFNPNEPLFNLNATGAGGNDTAVANPGGQGKLPLEMENNSTSLNLDSEAPSLFELADIENPTHDEDLLAVPTSTASNQISKLDDYASLETPLINTEDVLDTNPLLAQITAKGRRNLR